MVAVADTVRALTGKKPPRRSAAQILRGKVWLSYLLETLQLDETAFSAQFLEGRNGGQGSLIYRWSKETIPSQITADRIGKDIPASKTLYDLPLWTFLEDKPVSKSSIEKLIAPYWRDTDGLAFQFWEFPVDEFSRTEYPAITIGKSNSAGLFERGDLYGFTAIAAAVRLAEAQREADEHWLLVSDLYKAFPAIVKLPWIKPHLALLRECVEGIQRRFMTSRLIFSVDWKVIQKQIEDPTYETIRYRRPRDPKTFRFSDIEDPIIMNLNFDNSPWQLYPAEE